MTDAYLQQNIEVLQEYLQNKTTRISPAVFPSSANNSLRKLTSVAQLCRESSLSSQLNEFLAKHDATVDDLCMSTKFDFESRTVSVIGVLPIAPGDVDNDAMWRTNNKRLNSLEEVLNMISNDQNSTSLAALMEQFLVSNNLGSERHDLFSSVYNAALALKVAVSNIPDVSVRMHPTNPFIACVASSSFPFASQVMSVGKGKGKGEKRQRGTAAEEAEADADIILGEDDDVDMTTSASTSSAKKHRKHKARRSVSDRDEF